MNDRHPSGTLTPTPASDADPAHQASYGTQEAQYGDFTTYSGYGTATFTPYSGYDTGAFPTDGHDTSTFAADPLFGSLPGDPAGGYDASAWSTGAHQTLNHDPYAAQHHAGYDTGAYGTTAWTAEQQQLSAIPPQATGHDVSGQWDASGWLQPDAPADHTQQWDWGTQVFETGAYDPTQWNQAAEPDDQAHTQSHPHGDDAPYDDGTGYGDEARYRDEHLYGGDEHPYGSDEFGQAEHIDLTGYDEPGPDAGELTATGELPSVAPLLEDQEEAGPVPGGRAATRAASRSRRRPPPKRSALLTIAVPSACVMGVAGIAAASVGTLTGDGETTAAASTTDAQPVKPSAANNKLDDQLKTLSAGADDFADRASRTQERIDLKAAQEAEKKKAAADAARKERLRPKYALPVAQRGLSAYFGQAGINWMSVHTGIDFPVSYGTTVMAATDGTARTQWNSAYGNMMIVTAKDGTETWYCHLSSYRVASGTTVKAGDPIAYSGNSGNSTGPHLHFEVRPAGGSAIDPLPWLRSHGIDPT